MKISINNFKSIGQLSNYEMRPLTILSGTNSSGKSSFIQLLLLLKQTLEIDSTKHPLFLKGENYYVRNYLDILKNNNKENKLKIEFLFNKSDFIKGKDYRELRIYNSIDYNLSVVLEFDWNEMNNKIIVSFFEVRIISEEDELNNFTKFYNNNEVFSIHTDNSLIVENSSKVGNPYKVNRINYTSFFPTELEIETGNNSTVFLEESADSSFPLIKFISESVKLDGVKSLLKDYFYSLSYIGPYRNSPQDLYAINGRYDAIEIDGGNVAGVLHELAEKQITFFKIKEIDSSISFLAAEGSLLNAVKYWLCERFKLCLDIYSKKEADSYIIYVVSLNGNTSTIKHVGFGISQILPIIVEGIRMNKGQTLVLEQPEVHLHPKVQSGLADFLISLVKEGKRVLVETHSDHLITRLRRRIAEDPSNQLDNDVLLTFVEVGLKDVIFRNISINDFGIIELPYPDDFIEKSDEELRAILKAQMHKRLNRHKS